MWALARAQHGVVARRQLEELGFGAEAINHRLAVGRLHTVFHGVYAIGRPGLHPEGRWMAAVLACGAGALLSHRSAAALWGIRPDRSRLVEVSLRTTSGRVRAGIAIHRRPVLRDADRSIRDGIPVTSPVQTLVDLAARLGREGTERAVNEADRLDLVDPVRLRAELEDHRGEPGVARLRQLLDRRTFRLTRSRLERLFLPLAERAGLPVPLTKQWVNGFEVDFFWPELGVVVETDGLRHHRTPAQQAKDRLRDQAHTAAGLIQLRFTHEQVRYEPRHVLGILRATAAHLDAARSVPTPADPDPRAPVERTPARRTPTRRDSGPADLRPAGP